HGGVQPPRTHTRRARKACWASADNDYIRIIHLALVKLALWLAIERVSSGEPDKTGIQKKGWVQFPKPDGSLKLDNREAGAISANGMVRPCSCPTSKRCLCGAPKTRSPPWQKLSRIQSPSSASTSAKTRSTSLVSMSAVRLCCGRSGHVARWKHNRT